MEFKVIEYGSDVYWDAIELRIKILRAPLGLTFSSQEIFQGQNVGSKMLMFCEKHAKEQGFQ